MNIWLVAFGITLGVSSPASAQLSVCNPTPIPVFVAVGQDSGSDWVADGWWRVWPGQCQTVISGPLRKHAYYYHIKGSAVDVQWGGDYTFCTRNQAFNNLVDGNCAGRGLDRSSFHKLDVGEATAFRLDIQCDSACRLPKLAYQPAAQAVHAYYVHSQVFEGRSVHFPISGTVSLAEFGQRLRLSIDVVAELSHLQESTSAIVGSATKQYDECGDRVSTSNESLSVRGQDAVLTLNATYERWLCTSADLPQVKCEDTWIRVGPIKTKGIPKCKTWVDTVRTSKNKIVSQSGSARISFRPVLVDATTVTLRGEVESVRLDGMGQFLADLFNVNLKSLAQSHLDRALGGGALVAALPSEVRQVVQLRHAAFGSDSAGRLILTASGSVIVEPSQIPRLCQRLLGVARCQQ